MVARLSSLLVISLALLGCDDEQDPVDVPFQGIEAPSDDDKTPAPPPAPTASASEAPREARPAPRPTASRMSGCCSSLRAAANAAKDPGGKKMNEQAARVCSGLSAQVGRGKLTEAQALSQVRSSLLGKAPAACR